MQGLNYRMAKIFISFIHEELKVASAVQDLIRQKLADRDVFMSADQWQVYGGDDWLQKITTEPPSGTGRVRVVSGHYR